MRAAWEGIDPDQVWDGHCHLVGNGDSGSGIYLNEAAQNVRHPLEYVQRLIFMNAGCVRDAPGQVDQSYVERLRDLTQELRPGAKLLLLAFDANHTEAGEVSREQTSLYVPNRYTAQMAQRHAQYFEWAASVHPYRRDCVEQLEAAAGQGARALKW
ncbi:MAG: amidohydrolase, partial [Betaproteobacteria bacterium]|nr:amidohydrolase [Betaproteobacteria bacterium]